MVTRHVLLLLVIVLLLGALAAPCVRAQAPLPSEWRSQDGSPRPAPIPPPPPRVGSMVRVVRPAGLGGAVPPSAGWRGRICLVVADGIYDTISADLTTFAQDLESYGYGVVIYRYAGTDPWQIRSMLQDLYAEPASLVGAEFIGNLPYVIFERMTDWGSGPGYDAFACDFFFMDMNGTWSDTLEDGDVHAGNGKLDTWAGDVDLEIWVSRLRTDNLPALGTETGVLSNYFSKNHRFRSGELRANYASLIYIDDDWAGGASNDKASADMLYPSVADVLVDDPNGTTAADYMARVIGSYEYVHTRSHGWSGGHGYAEQDKTVWNPVLCSDYLNLDPPALFYSFFVCSGCAFDAADNLGGTVVFNESAGLLAWGATKTGGMWGDENFFSTVAQGGSFGQALVDWYNTMWPMYPDIAAQWWWGQVLIGDATLPAIRYSDVLRNHWAVTYIEACSRSGIAGGYSDGTYRPALAVNRGQMAAFISRALAGTDAAVPTGPPTPSFSDVPCEFWAYKHVEYAKAKSIVGGYSNGTYRPESDVDRGQMAVFVARSVVDPTGEAGLAGYSPPATPTFPDVTSDGSWSWCYKHVEYIASLGIAGGYPEGTYGPEILCTRDQMAVYITRAFALPL